MFGNGSRWVDCFYNVFVYNSGNYTDFQLVHKTSFVTNNTMSLVCSRFDKKTNGHECFSECN